MLKRLAWGIALAALMALLLAHRTELASVAQAMGRARASWLLVAAGLQALYWLAYAGIYGAAFRSVGLSASLWRLYLVTLAALPLNFVAAGSGTALYLAEAGRSGQAGSRAAAAAVVVHVVDFVVLAGLVAFSLAYLSSRHSLHTYESLTGLALLLVIVAWASLLGLGLWAPRALRKLLGAVARLAAWAAGRVGRPSPLSGDWAEQVASEYSAAASALASRPGLLWAPLGVAVVANLIDIAAVAALFAAFGLPIDLAVATTAFSMAVLFWVVAITPQGVGVVEGSMALTLHGLGVEATTATSLSLTFRAVSFWLPLIAGWLLLPRLALEPRRTLARPWQPAVAGGLCALLGVINLASAVTPSLAARLAVLEQHVPGAVDHGSRLTAAMASLFLLVWAQGLVRRKRVAWMGAVCALIVAVFANLLKGLDYEEALASAGLLVFLLAYRRYFPARSDRLAALSGLRWLALAFVGVVLYGTLGFYLLDRHFHINFGLRAAVAQTIAMFTSYADPGLLPVTRFGRWFADSIYVVAGISTVTALLAALRPVLLRGPASTEQRERATAIVEAHGRSGLARFCLFDDKSYWFGPDETMVAYTVRGGIALALGDPIGPVEALPAAVSAFVERCAKNDWRPAFYEVGDELLDAYRAAGLQALSIGQAAIVDLADFALVGKSRAGLRNTLHRFEREGWQAELVEPPISPELIEELREVSDTWLTLKSGNEKRFSLGWFDPDYLRGCRLMVVRNADGDAHAFANLVPEYQANQATVDLMRHDDQAPNSCMEYLFLQLLQWAKEAGYATFDLGLSALSGVGTKADDPAAERLLALVYEHANRYYSFKGLHAFKTKFGPRWEPRYLVHPGVNALPAVWQAVMRANGGDDFWLAYLRRRRPAQQDSAPATPSDPPGDGP